MAYTAAWSEAIPLGSLSAADIDQAIRDAKRDIRERVAGMFGMANWNADPLVVVSLSPTSFIAVGAIPATVGAVRLSNNSGLAARNFANTADINVVQLNAADKIVFGAGSMLLDPSNGNISFIQAGSIQRIIPPPGGNVTITLADGVNAALAVSDIGNVSVGHTLVMNGGDATHAPILLAASAAPAAPSEGHMWCVGNDMFRYIGGVAKKVTFV